MTVKQLFSIYSAHSPWQPLISLLSPRICLFWVFRRKELCQYMVLCVWFLSLSLMCSRCLDCFCFCITVSLMCVSHWKNWTGENNLKCMLSEWRGRARWFLWEGKPREPAKPEIKGSPGGASQGQLPLSKALPSLLCPSSSLTCVFLYFFQLLVSVSVFSSPLFFLPFYLCFSSLFLPLSLIALLLRLTKMV